MTSPSAYPTGTAAAGLRERLLATWKLLRCTRKIVDTGETVHPFGEAPSGYLNYAPDGRMMVLLLHGSRPKPKDLVPTDDESLALFRTMGAYAGRYSVEGNQVVHHIDASWNESLTGMDHVRYVRLEEDELTLTTDPYRSALDGKVGAYTLTWRRVVP